MQLFRFLSIGMLLSLPLAMTAGYERRLSVNVVQNGICYRQVDLFKDQFSDEDRKTLEFAYVTGIANLADVAREYVLPFTPLISSILRTKYIAECQDDIVLTEDCMQLRAGMYLVLQVPYLLNTFEERVLNERMERKKEFPEGSYVSFTFECSAPDVEQGLKQNDLDTVASTEVRSEGGFSESETGDTSSASSAPVEVSSDK